MGLIQGQNLGIECIKTENKQGNDNIKRLHYDINDVLYQYNKAYIAPSIAERIIKQLTEYGKELKGVEVQGNEALKVNEILDALRQIISSLKLYVKQFEWTSSDKEIVQKVINYCVYNFVEAKKGDMCDSQILKLLKKQKEVTEDYIIPSGFKGLNTQSFTDMNEELFKMLRERYHFAKLIR